MAFNRTCLIAIAVLLAGCTSFDQSDDGDSKRVLLGKTFTITLPALDEGRKAQVEKPAIVRFVDVERNSPQGMDTFQFKAVGEGETEIRIPRTVSSDEDGKQFVLTIRVVLGGSPY